ncbi:MAG TPA: acyloxyacyl hydrolase [Nitrospirota bacterium]|nr:acyloxyacyl hydrolase [Nitrospirota bacterium]
MILKSTSNSPRGSAGRTHLLILLCLLFFTHAASAQDSLSTNTQGVDVPGNPGRLLDVGTSQLGFWAGTSLDNPTLVGRTTNRPFSEFIVQYARVLKTNDNWALQYIAELVPVALIRQPPQGLENGHPVDLAGSRQTIYGAGVSPVGLQLNLRRGCVLQPYVNGTAGVLYFEDQVPVADSSKFNFELGLGAGVEIWYRKNQSIYLGYKYHHISNGYTARHNPGVDSDLFYIGCSWSWRP